MDAIERKLWAEVYATEYEFLRKRMYDLITNKPEDAITKTYTIQKCEQLAAAVADNAVETLHHREEVVNIIVNGRPKRTHHKKLDYFQIVDLAGKAGHGWTITFKSDAWSGSLEELGRVEVSEGMIFNVART